MSEITCHYCGCETFPPGHPLSIAMADKDIRFMRTKDHVIPRVSGGEEWVYSCKYCNEIKSDDPYEVFVAFIATKPELEGRWAAYREFKRVLMLKGLEHIEADAQCDKEPDIEQYDSRFSAHWCGRYSAKELRRGSK
jgi:hypothetical protein